jgi:hypothetical protein
MCSVIVRFRQIAKSDHWLRHARPSALLSICLSVRSSVRMEELGSYWTDFHEIRYFGIFRKSWEKIQVSLTSDENNGYFT